MGDYPAVAIEVIAQLGGVLVDACGIGPGVRVLDIAAGAGNVAIPAARTGATVVASDLTPEIVDVGRLAAARAGVEIEWQIADAEDLPCGDGEFDTVVSCVGVMFAPHHQASADELVRVCRPGGTVGLINWTPEGFVGQLFAAMRPFAASPAPGAQPPPLWGDPDHVRGLFGDRVTDIQAQRRLLTVDRFASPEEFREFFKNNYGPAVAVYRRVADDPESVAALDRALDQLAWRYRCETGAFTMDWEYLLFTARKCG